MAAIEEQLPWSQPGVQRMITGDLTALSVSNSVFFAFVIAGCVQDRRHHRVAGNRLAVPMPQSWLSLWVGLEETILRALALARATGELLTLKSSRNADFRSGSIFLLNRTNLLVARSHTLPLVCAPYAPPLAGCRANFSTHHRRFSLGTTRDIAYLALRPANLLGVLGQLQRGDCVAILLGWPPIRSRRTKDFRCA